MDVDVLYRRSSVVDGVDRISPNDLTTLVTDRGPAPMNIGAVLLVEGGADLEPSVVKAALERWVAAVPRLRHRLRSAPAGCGRPYWSDDEAFDISRHLGVLHVADASLWSEAAGQVCRPLPRDRPLWRACWCAGLDGDRAALVVVAHHVLADGLGGLAVLGALTDGPPPAPAARSREVGAAGAESYDVNAAAPRRTRIPSRRDLAADVWRARLRAFTTLRTRARAARSGAHDLGVGAGATRPRLCPRTPFNRPTGPSRRICTVEAPLSDVLAAGHRLGVTVNDIVLTAVTQALARAARDRGHPVESLVVSVPCPSPVARRPRPSGWATRPASSRFGSRSTSRPMRRCGQLQPGHESSEAGHEQRPQPRWASPSESWADWGSSAGSWTTSDS